MCNFAVEKIPALCGNRYIIKKLIRNGVSKYDEYMNSLNDKIKLKICSYITYFSDYNSIPNPQKLNLIQDDKIEVQLWEFKYNEFRLYCFDDNEGKVLVLGGTKNTQKKDIANFKKTVKEYLKENR
ncbi:MAG TPA: hypothetical protein PLM70_01450 [Bacteroidales bacterium]|nr:hypothetical protein [Bacteroidales bacterium]